MRRFKGLTLLELLFSLALLSLLFCFCFPLRNALLTRNQLEVLAKEISLAILYARNLAFVSHQPLILTPLQQSADWSKGMLLFVDNKNHHYEPQLKILHQWSWDYPKVQIKWTGAKSSTYLIFADEIEHAFTSGHFDLISQAKALRLIINRFGRIRTEVLA